jgi:cytochrome c oxidase subunit 3
MKSRSVSKTTPTDRKEIVIRPHGKVFLYMGLAAISVMFLGFSSALVYSSIMHPLPPIKLPVAFHYNTFVILASSLALFSATKAMRNDDSSTYRWSMGAAFLLGTTFVILQYIGWQRLLGQGIALTHNQAASYLYLISSLHALHVLVGVIALGYIFIRAMWQAYNPVSELMFTTDPVKKGRVFLLATYWHFVDLLWLYLYLFFLVVI